MEEQKAQTQDRFLRGRQIAYMSVSLCKVMTFKIFDFRWDEALFSANGIPKEKCPGKFVQNAKIRTRIFQGQK